MNILFVYPKPNISFDTTHCLPLGIAYISAVLEKEGHKVSFLDLNVQPDDLEDRLKTVDVVGVYAITPAIKSAWKICERVKKVNPEIITILGGPHPTVLPSESLEYDFVDVVVRKEGEYTFAELCDKLERNQKLENIKGISYKENGKIKHNPDREPIKNLDSLPFPAYHLFPLGLYGPTRPTWVDKRKIRQGTMITSRGCPFKCNFCFKGVHGNAYRYRSPQNVVDEIKLLVDKYNINFLEFQDDNFNFIPKRAVEICKLMVEEGIDIKWSIPNGISRVDKINRELLEWAKKSGCADIWIAVESGSQRVLKDVINKDIRLEQIRDAVKLINEFGFTVGGFVSMGNFGESREDILKSIDFACSLGLDRLQVTIVTPFPGSILYDFLSREGKLLITDWDYYGPYEDKVFFEWDGVTQETIRELYKKAYRKFYLRPSYILKTLTNPITYSNMPLIIKEAVRFMK